MTGKRIVIVDYGAGNLYSVWRAVGICGGENVHVSDKASDIAVADRIILPGVGAFADGMRGLTERGLVPVLLDAALAGKPLLGICLGMQMLATLSEEYGIHSGLDLIPGEVRAIPRTATDGSPLKVPFIGWSPVTLAATEDAGLLRSLDKRAIYLVHSFHFIPHDPSHLLASYSYGGHAISAAIRKGNITGVQFHPEKSGEAGLAIMRDFVECDVQL